MASMVLISRHKKRTPAMAPVLNTEPKISTAPLTGRSRSIKSTSITRPVESPDRHNKRPKSRIPAYSHIISYSPPNQNTII